MSEAPGAAYAQLARARMGHGQSPALCARAALRAAIDHGDKRLERLARNTLTRMGRLDLDLAPTERKPALTRREGT